MQKLTSEKQVHDLLHAFTASAALGTAIETGLLWMLAERSMDGASVVKSLGIPGKRGFYWLQLLENIGILENGPMGYTPSRLAREAILKARSEDSWKHLVLDERERITGVSNLALHIRELGSLWAAQGLAEPKNYVKKMRANPQRAREFTRMLFEVHQPLANQVAELLDLTGVERMMDLGGGSGVISMALLRKYPELTSTVVDIENVCVAGREIAQEEYLSDRISYFPANFEGGEFPLGFDLVLQCDVCVYSSRLLQKLRGALKPDGRLIFVEHFSPSDNNAPTTRLEWTFIDSLHNPNFSHPTLNEFKKRLAQAGFEVSNEHATVGSGLIILQARKRDIP